MPCNPIIAGFDVEHDYLACIDLRVNPKTFYFNCDFHNPLTSGITISCTAFTDSSCTEVVEESGYFATEVGTRYYSRSEETLRPFDFCKGSSKLKKCCGGEEIYNATNIQSLVGYLPPVGSVVQLQATDGNNKTIKSCFEVLPATTLSSSSLTVNNFYEIFGYEDCDTCNTNLLNTQDVSCYLSAGKYYFENCTASTSITLTIPVSNVYQIGDAVLFSGRCYYATILESDENSLGNVPQKLPLGCDDPQCKPSVPPQPSNLSSYVTGCCDNKIYRLSSNSLYNIGSTLGLAQGNFCYRVIPKPSPQIPYKSLDDSGGVIEIIGGGGCSDKKCQPCFNPPDIDPGDTANQCEIITIFPMGVKCNVINPTLQNLNGGILQLNITGGTAPYNITWVDSNGNTFNRPTVPGLPGGVYTAYVYDRYNDYFETLTCELIKPENCSFSGSVSPIKSLTCDKTTGMVGYSYGSFITC